MSKRTTITNGIRPARYITGFIALSFLSGLFQSSGYWYQNLLFFLIFCTITFLLYISRRIRFDEKAIYRLYGINEKVTSFESIESIKATGSKVNNRRVWKVTYLDKDGLAHKYRFLEGTFQSFSIKELIKVVNKVNPSVVVWTHPFFNKPEEKKD